MSKYRKDLLEQLRLAVIKEGSFELSDERLAAAVTVNEELGQLGYCLRPADIARLAKSPDLDIFYEGFRELVPDIGAKPMYPDFPSQVMEMEEALFRFHQICHYMSTYGTEELARLFGVEHRVSRGWLPETEETEKSANDERLLKAKTLGLVSEEDQYGLPLSLLLKRSERLTRQELEIVSEALRHVDLASLDFDIPFKQNMMGVFYALMGLEDRAAALEAMKKLCKHTGDVLKCADYALTRSAFRLRTSQKKQLVRLIESYPASDWKANVIISDKKARRAVLALGALSYNRFSRSEEHAEIVRQLRNGELRSWESLVKALLAEKDPEAIDLIASRPGMLLRWTNWLIKLGYGADLIAQKLVERADGLPLRTLVFAATLLGRDPEKKEAFGAMMKALERKLALIETPLKGKRVYIDEGRLILSRSMLLSKGDEAGYVRNGLAYRIPAEVRALRFFVYWNDPARVDVDLHASAYDTEGRQITVGWDADFKKSGIVHSGDITHSNAAEYIDADLSAGIDEISFNINLYHGKPRFADIQTCFAGMMAVKSAKKNVKLYDPANCFFYNDLRSSKRTLNYGYIDVRERCLVLDDLPAERQWMDGAYSRADHRPSPLTLEVYLEMLLRAQGAVRAEGPEDCDVFLVMEKPGSEDQMSLIDNNFFF